jgi:hypothetical protein
MARALLLMLLLLMLLLLMLLLCVRCLNWFADAGHCPAVHVQLT